jgi:hypothetical protein
VRKALDDQITRQKIEIEVLGDKLKNRIKEAVQEKIRTQLHDMVKASVGEKVEEKVREEVKYFESRTNLTNLISFDLALCSDTRRSTSTNRRTQTANLGSQDRPPQFVSIIW